MRLFFNNRSLVFSLLMAMALVAYEVSAWMTFFSMVALFWKWGSESRGWPRLSRKITGTLSVFLLLGILLQFRTFIGQEPSFTFLLGLAALKVLDYQSERDHKFVVLLGFLLLTAKALFSLDIYWLLPMMISFVGLWVSLFPVSYGPKLKTFAVIFVVSAPLALALFVLFPRFVIPWAMSQVPLQGQVGFSDELAPGSVAQLASQKQLVLRAKFRTELATKDLYWRGSVLSFSRGLNWDPRLLKSVEVKTQGLERSDYEVALEPLAQRYLFVLDGTVALQTEELSHLSMEGGIFRLLRPVQKTLVYQGHLRESPLLQEGDATLFLQVPSLPPKVEAWVQDIKAKIPEPKDRLRALERFFSEEGFVYSLSPGVYGANALEEFLFTRKKGFCEHFAGAYATLARALGWPARVVVGYQGGRYNPWGHFWVVSQQDAHAWAEILMDGKWIRQDPTQWVAPLRFEIGAEDFFSLSPEEQIALSKNPHWRPNKKAQEFYFETFGSWLESLNYRWTYFLIEFDRGAQLEFWRELRSMRWVWITPIVALIVLSIGLALFLYRQFHRIPPLERKFKRYEQWGRQRGVLRGASEPPLSYLQRLEKECPETPKGLRELVLSIDEVYAGRQGRFPKT